MSGCEELSPFALQVLGDSMAPEFEDGTIVVVDPGQPVSNGAYVIIEYRGETALRQWFDEQGRRSVKALNPAYPGVEITGPYSIRGVVIQQTHRRGGRRQVTHYV
jgi:DNA polymerase V